MFINQSQRTLRAVGPSKKGRVQEGKLVGMGNHGRQCATGKLQMKGDGDIAAKHENSQIRLRPFSPRYHLTQSTN